MDCQFVAYTDILQQIVSMYKQITRKWEPIQVAARVELHRKRNTKIYV